MEATQTMQWRDAAPGNPEKDSEGWREMVFPGAGLYTLTLQVEAGAIQVLNCEPCPASEYAPARTWDTIRLGAPHTTMDLCLRKKQVTLPLEELPRLERMEVELSISAVDGLPLDGCISCGGKRTRLSGFSMDINLGAQPNNRDLDVYFGFPSLREIRVGWKAK